MSGANYANCDNCGRKTIYIGEDGRPRFLIFCDDKCAREYVATVQPPVDSESLKLEKA